MVDAVDDTERGMAGLLPLVKEEREKERMGCTTTSVAPDAAYTHVYQLFKRDILL